MRKFSILLLLVGICAQAQIPNGYYSTATGSGYTLKSQLHDIIDGHTDRGYGALWDFYEIADVRSDGFVWDTYSDCDLEFDVDQDRGSGGSVECDKFNREHTFPQSWFNGSDPMRNDAVMVLPTDKKVNSERGSFPYSEVGSASYTSTNGSKKGSSTSTGYNGTGFEPSDEFKGDIARIYFYMATRYEDLIDDWESNVPEVLNGTSDQVYDDWVIDLMIDWHNGDPVSQKEIDRNDDLYDFQGNRNPFVDHPEWVECIWEQGCESTSEPLASGKLSDLRVYPNPVMDRLTIEGVAYGSRLQVVDIFGKTKETKSSNGSIDVSHLESGVYLLRINGNISSTTIRFIVR